MAGITMARDGVPLERNAIASQKICGSSECGVSSIAMVTLALRTSHNCTAHLHSCLLSSSSLKLYSQTPLKRSNTSPWQTAKSNMRYVEFHLVRTSLGNNASASFMDFNIALQAGSNSVEEFTILNASFRS
jgi:hypothetical protein